MRILLLSTSASLGGGPKVVGSLALRLKKKGHAVVVIAPNGPLQSFLKAHDIATQIMGLDAISVATFFSLVKFIKSDNFDVVHSHGKGAGLYGRAAKLLTRKWTVHTFHGIHLALYSRPAQVAYVIYERLLSYFTDCFINVSKTEFLEAQRLHLYPPTKAEVIYYGLDESEFKLDHAACKKKLIAEFGLSSKDIIFLCVARFDPVKNHEWLVRSFAKLPFERAKLLLVGDGDKLGDVKSIVASLGIGHRVIFAGSRDDVPALMAGSDIFVLASLREGLPITLQEAMFSRMPLLGSDTIGINDAVKHGENGLLFPLDDTDMFISYALKLLQDATLRRKMGETGHEYALVNYTMQNFVKSHIRIYQKASR